MITKSKQTYLNDADVKTLWKSVQVLDCDMSSSIPTLCDGYCIGETSSIALNNFCLIKNNHL